MAIIEGGHRILNDQFTAESLCPEADDYDEEEDMEETDDSDQSESVEEDEIILSKGIHAEEMDENDDEEGFPEVSPPPPPIPKRVESLSPASERKILIQVRQFLWFGWFINEMLDWLIET